MQMDEVKNLELTTDELIAKMDSSVEWHATYSFPGDRMFLYTREVKDGPVEAFKSTDLVQMPYKEFCRLREYLDKRFSKT
jgi:hypothetical protein